MSTSCSAVIIAGLPVDEILNKRLIDDDVIPVYDTGDGSGDRVAGYQIMSSGEYSYNEITWDIEKNDKLKKKFEIETGQKAKLYLTLKVY